MFRKKDDFYIYGLLWGLSELFLGGYLHLIFHPLKGMIMQGIGYTILAIYIIRANRLFHPLFIGLIAASFKFFNIFLFGIAPFSQGIINPAFAIIEQSLMATLISSIMIGIKRLTKPKTFFFDFSNK